MCIYFSIFLVDTMTAFFVQAESGSEDEDEPMDADQPESFVAHVPVPSQEEVRMVML